MWLNSSKYIFGLFLLFFTLKRSSPFHFESQKHNEMLLETNSITKALFEALIYIKEHPESLMKDVIFGILLGRANLQWAITNLKPHFNYEYLLLKKLRDMIGICDDIIEINKTETRSVLNPSLWRNAAEDLKIDTLHLQDEQIRLPKLYSCQNIFSYMMKGTPENSDFCINDLFESTCQVSDKCWFSETNKSFHSGYKTSHRLIYLQLATRLKCDRKNKKKFFGLKERKKKLCEQMLLEAKALRKENYFLLTRDLFLEQIALCGFEGYSEFANKNWRNEVVRWQSEEGCFGHDMPHVDNCSMNILEADNHTKKVKRTDSVIDKCHTHVTAVAISAMAFHLRFVSSMGLL